MTMIIYTQAIILLRHRVQSSLASMHGAKEIVVVCKWPRSGAAARTRLIITLEGKRVVALGGRAITITESRIFLFIQYSSVGTAMGNEEQRELFSAYFDKPLRRANFLSRRPSRMSSWQQQQLL